MSTTCVLIHFILTTTYQVVLPSLLQRSGGTEIDWTKISQLANSRIRIYKETTLAFTHYTE